MWEEWEEPLPKEESEKLVNHLKLRVSTPMIFEVFALKRPLDQATEPIDEKEEGDDKSHFEKRNLERVKSKPKDMGLKCKLEENVTPRKKEKSKKGIH